jgi:glycosyltransferase involved in cell wall biosynthesis
MPTVSVIMPSYNHQAYIHEAIESVLKQSFDDFELIIIDDASKDRSKEIIQAYEEKDDRIWAIYHRENQGIAKTVNEGLERAEGKFIALFSSDDLWRENKLKKQLEILEKKEDLIVWSEALVIDARGNFTGETFTQMHRAIKRKKSGYIFEELLKGNYICGQSAIFKRESVENIRFDEELKYLNDYKFFLDLARKYEFYFIPEPLVFYRIHRENTILKDRLGWRIDSIKLDESLLKKYGDNIPNKIKSKIFLRLSLAYSSIGKKEYAKRYFYQAIKMNPLSFLYLFLVFSDENGVIRNLLRWSYRKYQKFMKYKKLKI